MNALLAASVGTPLEQINRVIGRLSSRWRWKKGSLYGVGLFGMRMCVVGAIKLQKAGSVEQAIQQAIHERCPYLYSRAQVVHIPAFNDSRFTNHDDVMAVLYRAREIIIANDNKQAEVA